MLAAALPRRLSNGRLGLVAAVIACGGACKDHHRNGSKPLALWHSFNLAETSTLNQWLAESDLSVEPTVLPFARAFSILHNALSAGGPSCPDLIRLDAAWIPGLAEEELLRPAPAALRERDWLPEAASLASHGGVLWGAPQAIDGLGLVTRRDSQLPGWPPSSLEDLEQSVRASGSRIGLHVDGYWFLPFLRSAGADLPDPAAGRVHLSPAAEPALERFASWFDSHPPARAEPSQAGDGGIAADVLGARDQQAAIARQFRAGQISIAVEGPWAVLALSGGDPDALRVTPFPPAENAPAVAINAQILAVPRCSDRPEEAFDLITRLTEPKLQAAWSRELGTVPTTTSGLEAGSRLAGEFYRALEGARPLPRHRLTPELFDDLTPAIEAVVAGDATAAEALGGTRRAWRRIGRRLGLREVGALPAGDADAGTAAGDADAGTAARDGAPPR